MSGRESELRDVAGDGDRKRSCFTRRPLLCCSVLGVVLVIALVLCAVIPVLYVEVVEPEVDEVIDKNVMLTNGSVGTSQFRSSSAPFYSAYYMLNLSNPDKVQTGERPKLKEIGPFVYRENRTKYNLEWEEGGNILKYSLMINYTYDAALSNGVDPHTTMVTTVNVPLIGVLMKAEGILNSNEFEKRVLKEIDKYVIQKIVGEHLFVKRSVHDLLWGYTDPLLSDIIKVQNDINYFLSKFHKKIHLLDSAVFGFGNLSSVEMPNRVHTGLDDIDLVGAFRQWNGNYNMSGWGSEFAAMINGTGGFMFHPRVSREERLTAFIDELYRSGYFSYQEDTDVYGIQLYKYELPKEELVNTSQDPGFYANGPSGVLNLTAVVPSNVPLFVSKPHFLDADPGYLGNVSGLSPDRAKHDSYLSVEPITGAVLDAAKRIQVNFRLTKQGLPQLSRLADVTMLPMYWVAQTGTITPDLATKFKSTVYTVEEGISGGVWALTGVAGLVAVVCVLCLVGVGVAQYRSGRGSRSRTRVQPNPTETSPLLANTHTDI